MSNLLNTPSLIAAESLSHLSSQLVIASNTARDKTADFMAKPNGYAVGSTVSIKTYGEYEAKEFAGTTQTQDIRNSTRPMSIEKHFDISVAIGARELAMSFDGFSNEVLRPAMATLAEKIDAYCGTKILEASGLYVSSTLFESAADMAAARKAATLQRLRTGRMCLVDVDLEATILGQTVFNQAQNAGKDGEIRLRNGEMGRLMGMDFFSSIGFPTGSFTAGNGVTTTNGGSGANNLIGTKVLTVAAIPASQSFKAGDRLKIAGVHRPVVVASDAATGSTSVQLVDPIAEIIPHGAAVTVIGSGQTFTYRGVIMDDKSLAIAMPLLEKPSDKPSAIMSADGFSLRVVRGYDMNTKAENLSIDCLVGAKAYDPRRMTLLADV